MGSEKPCVSIAKNPVVLQYTVIPGRTVWVAISELQLANSRR